MQSSVEPAYGRRVRAVEWVLFIVGYSSAACSLDDEQYLFLDSAFA
jgi:hypothetical protein